ncbi:MAG: sigma-70 family RNA polymerase sigma factor [Chloroflexi bacterium]|nr:sigma-70 family RNA polymerase sigma factor [Chloroflexota bacterium]
MIQSLVELAEERGFVSFEQVKELLDDNREDRVALRRLLTLMEERGIELRHNDAVVTADGLLNEASDLAEPEIAERIVLPKKAVADISHISSDDPVGLYFRQMAQEPLLTAADEVDLAKRIERGFRARRHLKSPEVEQKSERWRRHLRQMVRDGQAAREHLGRANTRLVVSIAKRYMGQGLPFPDLIQEGNVGLMRAVDKYDYSRGNRFSTYATWWIRQAITRSLAQKTRTIRIPLHMTERIRQMYRTSQDLEQSLGRRPTPEEIATELKVAAEAVRAMMDASQHATSLERPVGEDGDSEFGDFIEDQESVSPVDSATQILLGEAIEEVLAELTPRQSSILRMRFGLGGGEPHTLEEIANKFGLSRERIRQLEKEALRRLRHPQVAHNLRDYLV